MTIKINNGSLRNVQLKKTIYEEVAYPKDAKKAYESGMKFFPILYRKTAEIAPKKVYIVFKKYLDGIIYITNVSKTTAPQSSKDPFFIIIAKPFINPMSIFFMQASKYNMASVLLNINVSPS
jgi:hypothetical protein